VSFAVTVELSTQSIRFRNLPYVTLVKWFCNKKGKYYEKF